MRSVRKAQAISASILPRLLAASLIPASHGACVATCSHALNQEQWYYCSSFWMLLILIHLSLSAHVHVSATDRPLWSAIGVIRDVFIHDSHQVRLTLCNISIWCIWMFGNYSITHTYTSSRAHQSSHLPCHWCDLSNFPTRQEYGLPKGWEHDIDDEEELPVSPELVRCHSNMQDRICQPKKNNSNNQFYIDVTDVTDVCIMCWRLRALSDAEPIASAVEPVARWGEPLCDAVVFMMLK